MARGVGRQALWLNRAAVSGAGRSHVWELETSCLAPSGLAASFGSGPIVLLKRSVGWGRGLRSNGSGLLRCSTALRLIPTGVGHSARSGLSSSDEACVSGLWLLSCCFWCQSDVNIDQRRFLNTKKTQQHILWDVSLAKQAILDGTKAKLFLRPL